MEPSNDKELSDLIASFRSGSEDAYEEVVHRFDLMIRSIALAYFVDVKDVHSEACLALRRALNTYDTDKDSTFGTYARKCVTNAVIDCVKRRKVEAPVSSLDVVEVAVSDGVQGRIERREEIDAFVSRARELLSDLEFDVFTLAMKGYKVSEIAARLGKKTKQIENAKARMLRNLREGLESVPEF